MRKIHVNLSMLVTSRSYTSPCPCDGPRPFLPRLGAALCDGGATTGYGDTGPARRPGETQRARRAAAYSVMTL